MKQNEVKSSTTKVSGLKKLVFNFFIVIISLALLLLFELGLRITKYGEDLSLFIDSSNYPGYKEINKKVNLRYFSKLGSTSNTADIFLAEKPDSCFRIFVFGGSTTRGFPYQEGTSFPRILYYQLQDAYPNKKIEVINLSASAINSFTYIDMATEVLKNKPDAVLVYGGHNEYYGALGVGSIEGGGNHRWIKKLRLRFCKLRLFQLIQNSILKATAPEPNSSNSASATLMARIAKDKDIPFNSKLYTAGLKQFENNLSELIHKCKRNNIPIIVSDLVSNVKDMPPFYSTQNQGKGKANDTYNEAISLQESGRYEDALKSYELAKDLDVIRFRAPSAINDIIYQLGKKENIPVVLMSESFKSKSPNGIIGDNLMTDHLHPNIDGYFLMSDVFFTEIINIGLISKQKVSEIKPISEYRQNWGFTALDSLIGDLNIKYLKAGWPFQEKNQGDLFLATYTPKSVAASMALNYVSTTGDRHIEDEHIKLAKHYNSIKDYEKAYKEYLSIVKMHPYITDIYYDASNYLIKLQKHNEALDLINSAPIKVEDHYFHYMVGTLELKLNNVEIAISHLEKAYELLSPEYKPLNTLKPLYMAYRTKNDTAKARQTLSIIRQTEPSYMSNKYSGSRLLKMEITVEEICEIAKRLINENDNNQALDILLNVDSFKSDPEIKRLLGLIYLKQQQYSKAFYYCKGSYELNPNNLNNLNNLFILSLLKFDFNSAQEMLSQMESLNIPEGKLEELKTLYQKKLEEHNPKN